jgi:hypothetical protein
VDVDFGHGGAALSIGNAYAANQFAADLRRPAPRDADTTPIMLRADRGHRAGRSEASTVSGLIFERGASDNPADEDGDSDRHHHPREESEP